MPKPSSYAYTFFTACTLAFCSGFLYGAEPQTQAVEIKDDAGNVLYLKKPAQRIISLAPHITEILFFISQGETVVGVDMKSDFPLETSQIPKVSDSNQIHLEAIIALQPDLIIAWKSGNNPRQLARLKALGYPVYFSEPNTLQGIAQNIINFGILTGDENLARKKADIFNQQLRELKRNVKTNQKVKVFYQVWDMPIYTINGEHIISEVIDFCGGENIFKDLTTIAPQVNIESVIKRNPDLIISGNENPDAWQIWNQWPTIGAVKNNQFLLLDSDHIVRAGPRILLGVQQICQKISRIPDTGSD